MANTNDVKSNDFALTMENYKLMLIGLAVIVVGFMLMAGGGTTDPNVFKEHEIFSFRRVVLAPIVVMGGFVFEIYAIMKRPTSKNQ